jgi:hypothetical protein
MVLCGLIGMVLLGACANPAMPTSVASPAPGVLAVPATPDLARIPAPATRATAVVASLQQSASTLRLPGLDTNAARAQDLALADRQVQPALRAPNGEPLRNEVFQSRPAGAGDLPPGVACAHCYRVEIYQYAINSTLIILVDLDSGRVVSAQSTPNSQPEVPKALADLAVQIAIAAPEMGQALGVTPETAQALMPQMKTALSQTHCERAQHLCVAPTFRKDTRLLWAVVDLTDMRLVGTQWSDLGPSGPPVTEKTIENTAISAQFCERDTTLTRDSWSLRYRLTSSDGLETRDAMFNGRPVIQSIKLVDCMYRTLASSSLATATPLAARCSAAPPCHRTSRPQSKTSARATRSLDSRSSRISNILPGRSHATISTSSAPSSTPTAAYGRWRSAWGAAVGSMAPTDRCYESPWPVNLGTRRCGAARLGYHSRMRPGTRRMERRSTYMAAGCA